MAKISIKSMSESLNLVVKMAIFRLSLRLTGKENENYGHKYREEANGHFGVLYCSISNVKPCRSETFRAKMSYSQSGTCSLCTFVPAELIFSCDAACALYETNRNSNPEIETL